MSPATTPRGLLLRLARAAIESAAPERCVPRHLPAPPQGRTLVVGAGKAAAAMALAVESHWPSGAPLAGLVVTRSLHGAPCRRVEVVEAAHPVPDRAGMEAAQRIHDLVSDLSEDDLVLALISGGGSSLLALPAPGLALADKQQVNRALLRCGASIHEINTVRKHLSAIKGGRLALACAPARVVTLAISDVPGDDPSVIASGPTVPDPTTFADALAILDRYGIAEPHAAIEHLRAARDETPKPGSLGVSTAGFRIIACARDALAAAEALARSHAITPLNLGDSLEGEASRLAEEHAALAHRIARGEGPVAPPCVLVSGGETTVTVRGRGRGGRNTEYLLALACALEGAAGIHALAIDTDGIDGTEDNAGAHVGPDTLARAATLGLDSRSLLADNDSHGFFAALDDLIMTGPTRTNVNDFRAILITAPRAR
ncbi:MAG: glycerate kinase [Opitutaceae bacterium]|nr:glycerate kinase [Opitutaceae bacterium]